VKVGRFGFNGAAQKIIDAQGHGFTCLREEKRIIERSTGRRGGQGRWDGVMLASNERIKWRECRGLGGLGLRFGTGFIGQVLAVWVGGSYLGLIGFAAVAKTAQAGCLCYLGQFG
jgi:hypothetical protein